MLIKVVARVISPYTMMVINMRQYHMGAVGKWNEFLFLKIEFLEMLFPKITFSDMIF